MRRVLPHSVDAEESVIGGLLFSGRAMTLVADIINSDDFTTPNTKPSMPPSSS